MFIIAFALVLFVLTFIGITLIAMREEDAAWAKEGTRRSLNSIANTYYNN